MPSTEEVKEVKTWRGHTPISDFPRPTGPVVQLQWLTEAEMPRDTIEQVVLRRGSSRKFAHTPISLGQLSTMLDRATRGVHADFLDPPGAQLNDLYLIVHAVDGLDSGAYVFHRDRGLLECLKQRDFREQAGYLGLEQGLPADAAVDVFFLADLRPILQHMGNRGYRAVQLEAGILDGKLYLAAYAQRLGATGLTFYGGSGKVPIKGQAASRTDFLASSHQPTKVLRRTTGTISDNKKYLSRVAFMKFA